MNRDLEDQLNEMGPAYREVVGRLLDAYRPAEESAAGAVSGRPRTGRIIGWSAACLAAASVAAAVGFAVVFRAERPASRVHTVRTTDAAREYLLAHVRNDAAVEELIRTQNADGSWQNDFLTGQNAAALKSARGAAARVAYKKAMRNLRLKGLL